MATETGKIFHSISRDNNMNAVRYYLALCILMNHFGALTGENIFQLPRIFGGAGSFFAISGFLMFSSFEKRPDTRRFFARRSRRIFPPYFLIVLVAAFGLSVVSELPLTAYFSDAGFWKYLLANLTFMNFLYPDLPGVFTAQTNLVSAVDGALWTMKGEVLCYLSVPLVYAWFRHDSKRCARVLLGLTLGFGILYILCQEYSEHTGTNLQVIQKQFSVFMLFFMGGYINLKLPSFLKYRWYFLVSNAVLIGCNYFDVFSTLPSFGYFYYYYLSPVVTCTMVLACCLTGHWGRPLANHDAVTYDIYLFHWPIIQVLVYFGCLPAFGAYPTLMLSILITVTAAFMSWHFVGKPILNTVKTPRPKIIT